MRVRSGDKYQLIFLIFLLFSRFFYPYIDSSLLNTVEKNKNLKIISKKTLKKK